MDENLIAGMVLGGFAMTFIVIILAVYVLEIIGSWKVMAKLGEPGWKSLIPFYRAYVEFKYTWKPQMMWLASVVPFIGQVLGNYEGDFISILSSILLIVGAVFYVIGQNKLSKAFGHGIGYTFGLVFLPGIFAIILGFGKSKYIGKP